MFDLKNPLIACLFMKGANNYEADCTGKTGRNYLEGALYIFEALLQKLLSFFSFTKLHPAHCKHTLLVAIETHTHLHLQSLLKKTDPPVLLII